MPAYTGCAKVGGHSSPLLLLGRRWAVPGPNQAGTVPVWTTRRKNSMRPRPTAKLLLACLPMLIAGAAGADPWVNPGGPTEAICDVSHVAEDQSGQSAVDFVFDGVPFTAANLTNVDFKGASLICIPETNGWSCDGRCVDFSAALLDGAQFQRADATGASFVGSDAPNAAFSGATLVDAQFLGAKLRGTSWDGANASGARFDQADLTDARALEGDATDFSGASLQGATLLRIDFGGSNTTQRVSFTGADLSRSTSDCRYTEVSGSDGTTTEVSDCPDFSFADFTGADLRSAVWRGADLGGADFSGASTRFDNARFDDVDLTSEGSAGADFTGAVLTNMALREAIFIDQSDFDMMVRSATFAGASLARADLSDGQLCFPFTFDEDEEDPAADDAADMDDADSVADADEPIRCDEAPYTDVVCVDWVDTAGGGAASIADRSLAQSTLVGVWAPGIDFTQFTLSGADLRLIEMPCATLEGADLTDTLIDGANFAGASFVLAAGGGGADLPADLSRAAGACIFPPAEGDTQPDPLCPRFDEALLEGVSFTSGIIDGGTFVGAQLAGADFSSLRNLCQQLPVDPDQNEGLTTRTFCNDYTGADLGPDSSGTPARFTGASMVGPIFDSATADQLVLNEMQTDCIAGQLPGDEEGTVVSHVFCASFFDTTITRADFSDASLFQARFGCLDESGDGPPVWACSDVRGSVFERAELSGSQWVGPVDLTNFDAGTPTDLANARLDQALITCQGTTYTMTVDDEDVVMAEARCPQFAGAVMTPGLDLSDASVLGIDWSNQDLTGADLSGATLGCFVYTYEDAAGESQSLDPICTELAGATLVDVDLTDVEIDADISLAGLALSGADLTRADLRGIDLSGADLSGSNLEDALMDADTRFNAGYEPDPDASAEQKKEDCTLEAGEIATDVRGAHLGGVNFTPVVDFGGECILYDVYTTYTAQTQGLTETERRGMTLVPEPGALVSQLAALLTLGLIARRGHVSRRG